MRVHARHNVDKVEPLAIEHFLGRAIGFAGEHLGAVQPRIGRGNNLDLRNSPPGFDVALGEEATPDDSAFQDVRHVGSEWAIRRSGCTRLCL